MTATVAACFALCQTVLYTDLCEMTGTRNITKLPLLPSACAVLRFSSDLNTASRLAPGQRSSGKGDLAGSRANPLRARQTQTQSKSPEQSEWPPRASETNISRIGARHTASRSVKRVPHGRSPECVGNFRNAESKGQYKYSVNPNASATGEAIARTACWTTKNSR